VTALFVPGLSGHLRRVEDAYVEMSGRVEDHMGRRPSDRRILRLWTRRGGKDCVTEVGSPDPIHGGTVMAIFDMGPHQPYVVYRQSGAGLADRVCEVLGCNAYSVHEFES
jgi:hypothetical protein